MCIRDSVVTTLVELCRELRASGHEVLVIEPGQFKTRPCPCLLYTSDAADERSSVDLGGRRIIKKKKHGDLGRKRRIVLTHMQSWTRAESEE